MLVRLVAPDELPHLRLLVEAPARLVEVRVRQVLLPLVELLGLVGKDLGKPLEKYRGDPSILSHS